ncbi:MAG: hypothetical protein ACXVQ7_08755 [Actinomycetota bacterium]
MTKTVTNTVAPPAYTASATVQARVLFDGKSCMYSGPAEVKAGTQATFGYTSTASVPSSLTVFSVSGTTTYEDVVQAVATRGADNPPLFMNAYRQSSPEGAAQQTLTTPLTEGMWVVACATSPTSTNKVFLGTMLRVLGG